MSEIQVLFDTPMQLGECPLWNVEEEALYWVDIAGCVVHRHIPSTGAHQSWSMPSEPGCIARTNDGRVLVAMRSGLFILNTNSGALEKLTDAPYDGKTIRFNDGRCDAYGRLWAGTLYEPRGEALGSLYRIERGQINDMKMPVTVSNGLAFSTDNRVVYHADTSAHKITAYDFDVSTGQISNSRIFKQFSNDKSSSGYGGRPDGAAVDSENAYWCAMYEGGRLLRLSSSGEVLREISLPLRCPTMIAFGGPKLRTLYVTSARQNRPVSELEKLPYSGCVLALEVDVAGMPEPAYIV